MGWRVRWQLVCDQCGKIGPRGQKAGSDSAVHLALKAGWLTWQGAYGLFAACPECKTNLSEELGLAQSLADSNEVRGSV